MGVSKIKRTIFFVFAVLIFVSCGDTKTSTSESNKHENPTTKTQRTYNVAEPTGDKVPDVFQHIQTLKFDNSGYDTKVLNQPLEDETIYTVQKGDEIVISNVVEYKSAKKTYIKVKTPAGSVGYIQIRRNPYKDGEYSYLETITVDGSDIRVLRITQHFQVSDGISIRSLPSEKSESLHEITHKEGAGYYDSQAITSDYKWVKIKLNEYSGWVPADSLSVGSGGPTINTPEAVISFDLMGRNEI